MPENEERPGPEGHDGRRQRRGSEGGPRGGARRGTGRPPAPRDRDGRGKEGTTGGPRQGAGWGSRAERGSSRDEGGPRENRARGREADRQGRDQRAQRPRLGEDVRRPERGERGDRPRREGGFSREERGGGAYRSTRDAGFRQSERGGKPVRSSRTGGDGASDRGERPRGGDRARQQDQYGGYRRGEPGRASGAGRGPERRGQAAEHNPGDLRSANRPDRAKSPEIDADVTGRELDRATARELGSLDERNRPWVAKHLVMAGRLLEIDPELSFEHALAASRRGGRLGCVREAVGLTAYAAGHYADALREFRTYRRITGDNSHLPEMVDCERAQGRHAKALELAGEVDPQSLDRAVRVELVIVLSGIHRDLGDADSALSVLQIPELDRQRGFSFSPRLFRAHADALEEAGRGAEAREWRQQARVAERALGIGEFADPEIVDFGVDEGDDRSEPRPRAKDLVPPGTATDDSVQAEAGEDSDASDTFDACDTEASTAEQRSPAAADESRTRDEAPADGTAGEDQDPAAPERDA